MRTISSTFLLALVVTTHAQLGGTLDPSFGTNGMVTTSLGPVSDIAFDVIIQPDDKLVAIGLAGVSSNPFSNDFGVVRYNSDGSLDPTFGTGGIVATNINADDQARAGVIQPDGKLVVVGTSSTNNNGNITTVRYNSNGTLDNSFGSNGIVVRSTAFNDGGFALALQPDGKLLVAGSATVSGTIQMIVIRYNPNGFLDNSFGNSGELILNFGHSAAGVFDIKIQPDGKILLGGYTGNVNMRDFAIVRLNPNGSLDTGFGSGGGQAISLSSGNDFGRGLAIAADGKILMCGDTRIGSDGAGALLRFTSNGNLDTSFGTNGFVTFNEGPADDIAWRLIIDDFGGILIAGQISSGVGVDHALIRFSENGLLDNSFGNNGNATIPNSTANALLQQPDGRIVTAGRMDNGTSNDFLISRYFGLTTSILDDAPSFEPKVFPNPSPDGFYLDLGAFVPHPAEVSVLNSLGQIVVPQFQVVASGPTYLDMRSQANGVYFLRIIHPQGISTHELLIQR